jgi:branched-subunit amino acid transport protein
MVAIPIFLFALRTKSLGGTVIMGMVLFWLAGRFFGGGI